MKTITPWDIRLARALVHPIRHTAIRPNVITTLSFLSALAAGAMLATGDRMMMNVGVCFFAVATILDHCDGEFARMTGRTSAFGHHYDNVADLAKFLALFVGMGVGLRESYLGANAIPLGVAAGIAVSLIFALRMTLEQRMSSDLTRQPSVAGFEIEDIMYLIVPITWLGGLAPFLVAVGIGTPLYAVWEVVYFFRCVRSRAAA